MTARLMSMRGSAEDAQTLEAILDYRFTTPRLLQLALTHPSLAGVDRTVGRGYERLEFLGDRVLGLVVAEWLLERYPDEAEGSLARRLTGLVRAESCTSVAETLGLGRFLHLAPGERDTGGRSRPAILADACEAVIGAIYQDGGLEPARRFIRAFWVTHLDGTSGPPEDAKTALQEWTLGRSLGLPHYQTLGRTGPDHAPVFTVRVEVRDHPAVEAVGPSKRAAEKAAAERLLTQLRLEPS
jgi:ribonuclease III